MNFYAYRKNLDQINLDYILHESLKRAGVAFHAASAIFQDDFIHFVAFGVKLHATENFSKQHYCHFRSDNFEPSL